ncbi:MAG: HAMP domain-containing protein [Sporomusa sp.]
MKKKTKFRFKSVYARFAAIFLGIWWGLNAITFSALYIMLQRSGVDVHIDLRQLIGFVYLSSAFFGTLIIVLAVRGIAKPIKKLSAAAQEVSGGNYDVAVDVKDADEIGRLAEDFNTMVQKIGSVDTLRRELVSNVSHEFRSPITSMLCEADK